MRKIYENTHQEYFIFYITTINRELKYKHEHRRITYEDVQATIVDCDIAH